MAIDARVEQVYTRTHDGIFTTYARVASPVEHSHQTPQAFYDVPIPAALFSYLENRIVQQGRPRVELKGRVGAITISLDDTMQKEFKEYQRKMTRSPTEIPALIPAGNSTQ